MTTPSHQATKPQARDASATKLLPGTAIEHEERQ